MPIVCTLIPHPVELVKDGWEYRWTLDMFLIGIRVPRTSDYQTVNLNPV